MTPDYTKSPPLRTAVQTLTDYTEDLTEWYTNRTSLQYRKNAGQYFTPRRISEFMIRQYDNIDRGQKIDILDPGAGVGIFESVLCEYVKTLGYKASIFFDLYENDPNLLPLLELNMKECQEVMSSEGFVISYRILNDDFVLSNVQILNSDCEDCATGLYDFIISNPPYFKLKRSSAQLREINNAIDWPPNIYALFMALSTKLLKSGGQMTMLTPRSYCSGWYFRKFREWLFNTVKPLKIHVFESRNEVFKKYNVLQENVILTAMKTSKTPDSISVSISNGAHDKNGRIMVRNIPYDRIIVGKDKDVVVRIPTSLLDELISACIDRFQSNLDSLGFGVSTGPVVPFRAKALLSQKTGEGDDFVPLIWMHNIVDGTVKWPIEKGDKTVGIRKTEESQKILIPSWNYVLVKRFSSKEGKQRICAGVYLRDSFDSDSVGIENHVNYIYKRKGELGIDEAYGIAALLSSKLYNRYFQIVNGNTQVNATELRSLPLPSLGIVRAIGDSVKNLEREDTIRKERVLLKALGISKKISRQLITKG